MSVLVVSDVHGNLEALRAVLKDSRGDYTEIWALGDVAGYGPDPGRCLDILTDAGALMVAGNHDLAACGRLDTRDFNHEARAALEIHRRILSDDHKGLLAGLPKILQHRSVTLVHGNPMDPVWGYVLDNATAGAVLNRAETSLTLVGHSHLSGCWLLRPESGITGRPGAAMIGERTGQEIRGGGGITGMAGAAMVGAPMRYSGSLCLANPGSVGQSRDGDPSARYMILDPERKTMEFRRCSWRRGALRRKMTAQGYPASLIARMAGG